MADFVMTFSTSLITWLVLRNCIFWNVTLCRLVDMHQQSSKTKAPV